MKFLHTADWHIGRKLNGFSLLEEQEDVFHKMMAIAKEEDVDAIVIAGDIYDRSIPSIEAVALFNEMMIEMNIKEKYPVLAISGNHDSSTRLETGSYWLKTQGFHLHTRLEEAFIPVILEDTQFFLLPYFEPFHVRQFFGDDRIKDIKAAMIRVVEKMTEMFDQDMNHVLVSHFFAAGSSRSDSETSIEVGGLDSVPMDVLEVFDYVALGHLHDSRAITSHESIQYSGALLKYSLSEEKQEKGIRIVELKKQSVNNTFIPLSPLRDVAHITASHKELTTPSYYNQINREDYLGISLTDTTVITNLLVELRQIYPRIISLDRVTHESKKVEIAQKEKALVKLSPDVLLKKYFEEITEEELTEHQLTWIEEAIIQNRKEK